jgi:hypothetical protein
MTRFSSFSRRRSMKRHNKVIKTIWMDAMSLMPNELLQVRQYTPDSPCLSAGVKLKVVCTYI